MAYVILYDNNCGYAMYSRYLEIVIIVYIVILGINNEKKKKKNWRLKLKRRRWKFLIFYIKYSQLANSVLYEASTTCKCSLFLLLTYFRRCKGDYENT